jgi:hypothetical protein
MIEKDMEDVIASFPDDFFARKHLVLRPNALSLIEMLRDCGRPALGLRKRTGQVEEFDLFFTHSLKLHLIRPKTGNNKINDIWAFGCGEND